MRERERERGILYLKGRERRWVGRLGYGGGKKEACGRRWKEEKKRKRKIKLIFNYYNIGSKIDLLRTVPKNYRK